MMTDYRHELEQLLKALDYATDGHRCDLLDIAEELKRARAALSEPVVGPAAPSDEELKQILDLGIKWYGSGRDYTMEDFYRDARALLARIGTTPTPIPVAERLPGEGDCDAEGRCWLATTQQPDGWVLDYPEQATNWDQWLPAHALPLPAASGEGAL